MHICIIYLLSPRFHQKTSPSFLCDCRPLQTERHKPGLGSLQTADTVNGGNTYLEMSVVKKLKFLLQSTKVKTFYDLGQLLPSEATATSCHLLLESAKVNFTFCTVNNNRELVDKCNINTQNWIFVERHKVPCC